MSYLEKLYEVETKLTITHEKEKRVKEIEEELKIEDQIKNLSSEIDEINLSKSGFIKRKNEIEREIEETERELKSVQTAIESNQFKTQKELKAAKKTEENLVAKLDELKKSLSFVNSEIADKEKKIKEISDNIVKLKDRYNNIQEEYNKLEKEIKEEREALDKEFDSVLSTLPLEFAREYLSIREDFPDGAISQVDHGHCGNCGVKLPLEFIEFLKETKGDKILRCEICGKILYLKIE
ncbi:MAG: zinc ribbon domain-containing protein [Caldisericum sp.]